MLVIISLVMGNKYKNNIRRLAEKDYKVVAKLTSKPEIENVKGYDIIVVCTDHGKFSNFENAVDKELKKLIFSLEDGDSVDIAYEYDKKYRRFKNFYDIKLHRLDFDERLALKKRFLVNCVFDGVTFTSEDKRRKGILNCVVKKNYHFRDDYFGTGEKILSKFEYPERPCAGKLLVERYEDSNDYRSWEILLPVEFKADNSSVEKIA